MAARPAKRQRRSTRVLSDDDDEYPPQSLAVRSPKPQRQLSLDDGHGNTLLLSPSSAKTRSLQTTPKKAAKASPKPSPDKTRKSSRLKQEPDKSKSLHSFFGKASEEQRWQRKKSSTPEVTVAGDEGDAIEDDELPDQGMLDVEDTNAGQSVLDRRNAQSRSSLHNGTPINGTSVSRFLRPTAPFRSSHAQTNGTTIKNNEDSYPPWAERYEPTSLDELAVHKKKVNDVQQWFEGTASGRLKQKLLVLKGPAGTGKTTTVSLVAKALGMNAVFWQNPGPTETAISGSVAAQFDDFLNRGGHFGSLAFDGSTQNESNPQILVVEEFPASTSRSSNADALRTALQRLLSRNGGVTAQPFQSSNSQASTHPVVIIISETLLSSSTAFSDSFTAHRLLGPEILNHPAATVIEFNPVAQTFIHKALDLVVKKEARNSLRRRIPGPAVMQHLAEMGDVRNAVNALEFLCIRSDNNSDWSGSVAGKGKKSSKGAAALTDMERDSLKLVSQRETTLDMFHAAGKVVYNKREDPRVLDSRAEPPPKPPDHLMHLYTIKVSQVDIEALFNETGTDIQTFISSLHENYALSCNGEHFTDSFDECASILSTSDVLNPDSRRSIRSRAGNAAVNYAAMQAGSTDALRQEEISFNVATRGLLFHLPYPVNRSAPSSGRQSDKFKMFYPTSLRLWKPTEEVDSLISFFTHDESLSDMSHAGSGGVAAWKNVSFGPGHAIDNDNDTDTGPRKALPSRDDLTLDVLPYLARIKSARKEDTKLISRVVQFHNTSVPVTGDEPDDEEPQDEAIIGSSKLRLNSVVSGRAPGNTGSQRFGQKVATLSKSNGSRGEDNTSAIGQMEELYLEDDDIED